MGGMNLETISENIFEGFQIDGSAVIEAVSSGKIGEAFGVLAEAIMDTLGNPIVYLKEYFITLTVLGIGAILVKQLGLFFKDSGVQKISFWIVYLILTRQLLSLYYNGEAVAIECLQNLVHFGNVFIPAFSVVLTVAAGSITGAGYIAALMFIIYVIEQFLMVIMIPITEGYMLLCLLGALWHKDRVEKLLEFLEKMMALGFKGMFAAVTGLGVLQSMILPYADSAKTGAAKKFIELIPGIGNLAGNTMEIVSGSAILLKNGIGVIGILLLLFVSAAPLIKIGLLCLVIRLAAVVYGLLGEKQMTWCADKLGMAEQYLLKITSAGMALFLLWIILAVYTTNQRLGM